jgi:hypothetical protein
VASIERIWGSDDTVNVDVVAVTSCIADSANWRNSRAAGFVRVHRSHIVNVSHIVAARGAEVGRLDLTLRSGVLVPVSRSRVSALRKTLRGSAVPGIGED